MVSDCLVESTLNLFVLFAVFQRDYSCKFCAIVNGVTVNTCTDFPAKKERQRWAVP
ncbi:hypothetical protein ALQ37_101802 [Pseudomonas syringae pv. aptata]|uniref:Uncharacterized protein n=2 Tax=Pseudomonas syringae TaxID=317 RepID=F3FFU3_PSESX|nr:hypothetical protein PSYJA_08880 [Pseudomonas syringae pv. japonica str. M301072]KPY98792.1 hypothetical protein ALO85_101199 [Pseudomonas syringae pv. aptata]RMM48918.1 hypothetical protein ALQ76_101769 [Pseudomonas syringae pv. atrofaciens]RMO68074.1 hypothetical protein ALQ37_101802 [Pseudomonas syringae pv. aptata]